MYQTELTLDAVNPLFSPIRSDFGDVLRLAADFYDLHPDIEADIHALQTAHALRKKHYRQLRAVDALGSATLPFDPHCPPAAPTTLADGRPRMPPKAVFLLSIARAYADGLASRQAATLLLESCSLHAVLAPVLPRLPGMTTILENTNLLNAQTLAAFNSRLLRWVQAAQPTAAWQRIVVDSTAVYAAASHPCDSALLHALMGKALTALRRREDLLGIPPVAMPKVERWLQAAGNLHRRIGMTIHRVKGGQQRRKLYRQLCQRAIQFAGDLLRHSERLDEALGTAVLSRAQWELAAGHERTMLTQLGDLVRVCQQVGGRLHGAVPVAVSERLLSIKDRDAAIIVKGGREAVFGYKVQLAFTGLGYCTGLVVNHGNGSDSRSLAEVVQRHNEATGIVAAEVSVDDGYAGTKTAVEVANLGVKHLSVSGAKGRRQLGELWDEPTIRELRVWRPAAEARIYLLKRNVRAGRVSRSGRAAVEAELMAKVLVFNLDCILRQRV